MTTLVMSINQLTLTTNDLILMVSFRFTMRRHLIRLASTPFTCSSLAKLGVSVCCVQRLAMKQNGEFTEDG